MKLLKILALASALLISAPAFSMEKNPWTKCGIGAMIFDETPWAAAVSNVIWDLGTTAVTSAGASEETCKGKDVQAALFIQESYASLEEETAKGSGQHVSAMLNIMGCDAAAHDQIIQSVRADFANAVSAEGYASKPVQTKAESYYTIVRSKVMANSQCQIG